MGLPLELGVCCLLETPYGPTRVIVPNFVALCQTSRAQVGTQNIGEAGRQALSVVETSSSRSCEVNSW